MPPRAFLGVVPVPVLVLVMVLVLADDGAGAGDDGSLSARESRRLCQRRASGVELVSLRR